MKIFFASISFLIGQLVFCQSFRLEGYIPANNSGTEIGQLVVFSLPDSALIKGTYLDSSYFSLLVPSAQKSDYFVKIKLSGYVDTLFNFHRTDSVVKLGIINLQKDLMLDIVDVIYSKPLFEPTIDGITVNIEGTTLETLNNLFEVLKSSPKIMSPDGESIEIIGKGVPLILVDGQPILSNDELKSIPANMIQRIEIITNPSAKYRAQGRGSGVIEVYTKNYRLQGYNMSISSSGGINTQLKPTGAISIGLSLKKRKFSLNAFLFSNYVSQNSFGTSESIFTDGSNREIDIGFNSKVQSSSQFFNLKTDYQINGSQKITGGIRAGGYINQWEHFSSSLYYFGQTTQMSEDKGTSFLRTWLDNSAFLNYSWETDTNRSNLEINLNYQLKVDEGSYIYHSDYENFQSAQFANFDLRNNSRNRPNIGELRVTYEHVFDTTGWKLVVGGSYSILLNGMKYDAMNLEGANWILDPVYSNSYDYIEQIGGAFAELTKDWKKVSARVGIRCEYTNLNGYSHSLLKQFMDSAYVLPFPSASIMYRPGDKIALTIRYSSGIDRPQFSNFDPFVRIVDSLSIQYGNPYLLPTITQSLGFDLDLFYEYRLSIDYYNMINPSANRSFIDDSTFLYNNTPMNADRSQQISFSLNLPLKTKWISGWNSIYLVYGKYEFSPVFNRADFTNISFSLWSLLNFNLNRNITITNTLYLYRWGDFASTSNLAANWGIKITKSMFNDDLQIFLDVSNIVPPKNITRSINSNFESVTDSRYQFTSFQLGVFYKFGRLKQDTQIKESSSGQSGRI